MNFHAIKKFFSKLRTLPFHPQWFVYRDTQVNHKQIGEIAKGLVLDIGCADQFIRRYLVHTHQYIGLDYYQTATEWYATRPQVFGDAQSLPFANASVDTVLLLDVLEHLPRPDASFSEIVRVLKSGGIFVLQVPFLYPIHDAPLDFQRWTCHGLERLIKEHGFRVIEQKAAGNPMQTAGLLFNIALSKTVLNWLKTKHPALILGIFAPFIIFLVNLFCWLLNLFSVQDAMMAYGYRYILEKSA